MLILLTLVYLGISLTILYIPPSAFNGISCQGLMVEEPSLKNTRKDSVPASPATDVAGRKVAARAKVERIPPSLVKDMAL